MRFDNQVVVITGAGEGIGRSIALHFAELGAKVVVVDINEHTGRETVDLIYDQDHSGIFLQSDVTSEKDVKLLMENVIHCYGKIDILFNNVGEKQHKPLLELSIEEWNRSIDMNLKSVFLCSKEALRYMKVIGKGHIINIASTKSFINMKDSEAYSAAKGGVISMTQSMSASLRDTDIRVNCISPGYVRTRGYERLSSLGKDKIMSLEISHVDDIAKACVSLAYHPKSYVNGSNIIIDNELFRRMVYLD